MIVDKFGKKVKEMSSLSKKEGRELDEELRDRCECPACPTYAKCAKERKERLFCYWGDSECITLGKDCICPSCTVYQEAGMKKRFYCLEGPEIIQREMPEEDQV